MIQASPEGLLRDFNLRNTAQRIHILQTFLKNRHALSHTDLETELEGKIDRATIYRCLKQFLDAGILHRIPDDQFQTKYAVCSTCEHTHHHHDHVHFNCQGCNETTCIEQASIPGIQLPEGYVVQEKILIIQGFCASCAKEDSASGR
jgi:Fur family ferric uptake transcriptional regulator